MKNPKKTALYISHDIVVEGLHAFMTGEEVFVEGISPDPVKPEYKYIVLSSLLQDRFLLKEEDLVDQFPGYVVHGNEQWPDGSGFMTVADLQPVSRRRRMANVAAILVVLLITVVLGGFDIFGNTGTVPEPVAVSPTGSVSTQNASPEPTPSMPVTPQTTVQAPTSGDLTTQSPVASPLGQPDPALAAVAGSGKMTLEKYERIQNGMTYDEVVKIAGDSGMSVADLPNVKEYEVPSGVTSYLFPGNNPSNVYAAALVVFENGAVIAKYQEGLI